MSRKISQREARRTVKELHELRNKLDGMMRRWGSDWPGEHIFTIDVSTTTVAVVKTARKLGHAVVVTVGEEGKLQLWGSK